MYIRKLCEITVLAQMIPNQPTRNLLRALGGSVPTLAHFYRSKVNGEFQGAAEVPSTWWLIPRLVSITKWVLTPVINGISRVNPLIIVVMTHLLSEMSHQVHIRISLYHPCCCQCRENARGKLAKLVIHLTSNLSWYIIGFKQCKLSLLILHQVNLASYLPAIKVPNPVSNCWPTSLGSFDETLLQPPSVFFHV